MTQTSPLLCFMQTRNTLTKAQLEAMVPLHPSFAQTKRKSKKHKKKSTPAKQWRQCKCGRLFRLTTGLCACSEATSLPKHSPVRQQTKQQASETIRSDDQSANKFPTTELTVIADPTLKSKPKILPFHEVLMAEDVRTPPRRSTDQYRYNIDASGGTSHDQSTQRRTEPPLVATQTQEGTQSERSLSTRLIPILTERTMRLIRNSTVSATKGNKKG